MPTRNINLTDHFDKFVDKQIASGEYQNASEVLRAGLQLLMDRKRREKKKLQVLRRLAAEGFNEIDQGGGIDFDSEKELDHLMDKIEQRASALSKRRRKRSA